MRCRTLLLWGMVCGVIEQVDPAAAATWPSMETPEIQAGAEAMLPKPQAAEAVTTGPPLRDPDMEWVNRTLASMTLEEKIGQMIMPTYSSGSAASLTNTYRVGGFIFLGNSNTATGILNATNALQGITSVPLLFSIDCEPGLGARVTDATRFPMNMASGAVRSVDLARAQGGVTARECRAVGVHIGFGPVLDVNTEPVNPIIGVRAYSDKVSLISSLAAAYVEGANAEGLLCTYKHFPGHGAATGDSHSSLPTISIPLDHLMARHVSPYTRLLGQGTGDLVMTAHVWYTELDPGASALPATLSANALTGILRNQLAYGGVVISDAFDMAGLQQAASTYDGVRIGVQAGLDIILMPPSVSQAFNGLRDAVNQGQISVSRIEDSVRRILILKSRAGMPETTTVSASVMSQVMRHPENLAVAADIARRGICSIKVQAADLPLSSTQSVLVYNLTPSSSIFYRYSSSYFNDALRGFLPNAAFQSVATSQTPTQIDSLVANARNYERVVITCHDWKPTISASQQTLVTRLLAEEGVTPIYCSFGSPYQIHLFPEMRNYFCAFSTHFEAQAELARILVGAGRARGSWPVELGVAVESSLNPVQRVNVAESDSGYWALNFNYSTSQLSVSDFLTTDTVTLPASGKEEWGGTFLYPWEEGRFSEALYSVPTDL